jgi:hypothetical protein
VSIACTALDVVATAATGQDVVTCAAVEGIVPLIDDWGGFRPVARKTIRPVASRQDIGARVTLKEVVAFTSPDRVVATSAEREVGARPAVEAVGGTSGGIHRAAVHPRECSGDETARLRVGVAPTPVRRGDVGIAQQRIVARAADENVATLASREPVIAERADEQVVVVVAGEPVTQRSARGGDGRECRSQCHQGIEGGRNVREYPIASGTAFEDIGFDSTFEDVVAYLTVQTVAPGAAVDAIGPGSAEHGVRLRSRVDAVVDRRASQRIAFVRVAVADDRVRRRLVA